MVHVHIRVKQCLLFIRFDAKYWIFYTVEPVSGHLKMRTPA